MLKRFPRSIGAAVLLAAMLCAMLSGVAYGAAAADPDHGSDYVGQAVCASCHQSEAARWRGSHHAKAMQVATDATVLGDFGNRVFAEGTAQARFFRDGQRFMVATQGRSGRQENFVVSYTFGVFPLQQYLIAFPDGRMQALTIAWDARPAAQGGQRWFLPLGKAAPPGDALHWTGRQMNWNLACAACHSTDLHKGYDAAADRFVTTWSDVDVGCEACHGPGAGHVAWAGARHSDVQHAGAERSAADDARGFLHRLNAADVPVFGFTTPGQAIASRLSNPVLAEAGSRKLSNVCFGCHARREQLVDAPMPGDEFLDDYRPALLTPDLYQADGQNSDEVFEYGAFAQSRMARAGVTCVNCHDAHDLSLRAPGNGVCAQCHAPAHFDTASHTHHQAGSPAGQCVSCHMPQRTYMGVHVRHDHGFRLPRPELADISVANGCTSCHADRSSSWLAEAVARWGAEAGRAVRPTGFADAFAAAAAGAPADGRLRSALGDVSLAPIVRATAASLLRGKDDGDTQAALGQAARDADPVVRMGVAQALDGAAVPVRVAIGGALLADPVRAVRLDAAYALADLAPGDRPASWQKAMTERERALATTLDRPETRVALGGFLMRLGRQDAAARAFDAALRLDPAFTPALVDLADLRRAAGDEAGAEALLVRAVGLVQGDGTPDGIVPLEALALLRVRQGRTDLALDLLGRAVGLAPGNTALVKLDALALSETGRHDEAGAVLRRASALRPRDAALLENGEALERLKAADLQPSR